MSAGMLVPPVPRPRQLGPGLNDPQPAWATAPLRGTLRRVALFSARASAARGTSSLQDLRQDAGAWEVFAGLELASSPGVSGSASTMGGGLAGFFHSRFCHHLFGFGSSRRSLLTVRIMDLVTPTAILPLLLGCVGLFSLFKLRQRVRMKAYVQDAVVVITGATSGLGRGGSWRQCWWPAGALA